MRHAGLAGAGVRRLAARRRPAHRAVERLLHRARRRALAPGFHGKKTRWRRRAWPEGSGPIRRPPPPRRSARRRVRPAAARSSPGRRRRRCGCRRHTRSGAPPSTRPRGCRRDAAGAQQAGDLCRLNSSSWLTMDAASWAMRVFPDSAEKPCAADAPLRGKSQRVPPAGGPNACICWDFCRPSAWPPWPLAVTVPRGDRNEKGVGAEAHPDACHLTP